jgi:glucosamine-6-phosphate deaminase
MKTVFENKGLKIVSGDKAQLEEHIANEFADIINSKDNAKIILATGNSPVALYKKMINLNKEGKLSFENVESFNLDEYLGMNDEQFKKYSFREFMNNNLFNHVNINKDNTHFPTKDTDAYNALMDEKVDKFD